MPIRVDRLGSRRERQRGPEWADLIDVIEHLHNPSDLSDDFSPW
jgi:hypothetical protein